MSEAKQMETLIAGGREVLPYLAEIYQQLYLKPGTEDAKFYPQIVLQGMDAPEQDLSHFQMDEKDRLELVETPAGQVMVVTLNVRADFEMFLYIVANKCQAYDIPATQGASILDGVINWQKICTHRENWFASKADGSDPFSDWPEEFERFTSVPANYKDALIILSTGPYSNIPAEAVGISEPEWLKYSYEIRKYHECTHFICRRKYPDQISPIWDEVMADAVGIAAAFGQFDPAMEEVFLGINESGYTGGRLENYVENREELDATARKIHEMLQKASKLYEEQHQPEPFDFAMLLEERQQEWW